MERQQGKLVICWLIFCTKGIKLVYSFVLNRRRQWWQREELRNEHTYWHAVKVHFRWFSWRFCMLQRFHRHRQDQQLQLDSSHLSWKLNISRRLLVRWIAWWWHKWRHFCNRSTRRSSQTSKHLSGDCCEPFRTWLQE